MSIEKNIPVPIYLPWEKTLSLLEKGDSFSIQSKENLFILYKEAAELGLEITHAIYETHIRVWRIN